MPEGWRVSLITNYRTTIDCSDVCFAVSAGQPVLVGDMELLVTRAGYSGLLAYFAEEACFGIPVRLTTHPLTPSFWWLFRDFRNPQQGRMRPMSWLAKQPYATIMEVAEFAACRMKGVLKAELEARPDIKALAVEDLDTWLGVLMQMFVRMPGIGLSVQTIVPDYATYVDAESGEESLPYLQRHIVIFRDNSRMVMHEPGFDIVQEQERSVPDLVQEPGKPPRYRKIVVDGYVYRNAGAHIH